jgi:hypothetical protein
MTLYNLHDSPTVKVICAKHVSPRRNACTILLEESEETRSFGRSMNIWWRVNENLWNQIGCEDVNWIHLAQGMDQWRTIVLTLVP